MTAVDELDDLLTGDGVRSVFQPIVELSSSEVIGAEALARGPVGSQLESPLALFDAARRVGREAELDWRCRASAISAAIAQGWSDTALLFVNVEPRSFGSKPPPDVHAALSAAEGRIDIVVEVTERDLLADPAAMLVSLRRARELGFRIALDDVGADSASLALMPVIDPDVIKLDLRLVQSRDDRDVSTIACAVMAQAERSGALILAEGIETSRHLAIARTLGAHLGQGFLFARPEPAIVAATASAAVRPSRAVTSAATPWQALPRDREIRTATKRDLLGLSRHLERVALNSPTPGVMVAAFQHSRNMTLSTSKRYVDVARHCSLVVAAGAGMARTPVAGVRGVDLPEHHPLNREWVVATIGAHDAAALIAHDMGDVVSDMGRRFRYTVTHQRDLVIDVVRSVLGYT